MAKSGRRSRVAQWATVLVLVLAACGGGSDDGGSTDGGSSGGGSDGGAVVDRQPPGQAMASVDGHDFTLTTPGGVACNVSDENWGFSFIMGDNQVVLGGGAIRDGDGWFANVTLRIAEPDSEPGPISYFPDPQTASVAVDGDSVSISGPMQKQPPNDGSNPPPVDAGEGTFSFTCG